jgi:hypothetical protein
VHKIEASEIQKTQQPAAIAEEGCAAAKRRRGDSEGMNSHTTRRAADGNGAEQAAGLPWGAGEITHRGIA